MPAEQPSWRGLAQRFSSPRRHAGQLPQPIQGYTARLSPMFTPRRIRTERDHFAFDLMTQRVGQLQVPIGSLLPPPRSK